MSDEQTQKSTTPITIDDLNLFSTEDQEQHPSVHETPAGDSPLVPADSAEVTAHDEQDEQDEQDLGAITDEDLEPEDLVEDNADLEDEDDVLDDVDLDDDDDQIDDEGDDTLDDDEDDTDTPGSDEPSFASLGLPDELLEAVTQMGYATPTPIQAEAIPPLLAGRDVVGIAQTGTGKTAAFGLPLLATINHEEPDVQALVLAPTRELALQSAAAMSDFAARSRNVGVVAVYGGASYTPQLKALEEGAQVVVGTPGRIMDLMRKGALSLDHVKVLVLDEADEMLRMGFAEDVEEIASHVPEERLTALFSATMPASIERVAKTHLHNPVKVAVSEESSTVDTIHQTYAVVPFKHKLGALSRVLATRAQSGADAALVFVRTRLDVEEVSLDLTARGFRAAGISGDVAQNERERMVQRLRTGTLDVLVATDVAARGLDVERIGLVVNFDVPREPEAYVHRIGRTGRAGREGLSMTFFGPTEAYRLRRIEKLTGTPMEEVQIPSPADVSEFRAKQVLSGVQERLERGRLNLYQRLLTEQAEQSGMDVSDIAAVLLAQAVGDEGPARNVSRDRRGSGRIRNEEYLDENGEFLSASFEGGRDRKKDGKRGEKRSESRRRGGGGHFMGAMGTRYRIEVGKKDGVNPGAIVGAITGEGGLNGSDIGHIDLYPTFSLVDIAGDLTPHTMAKIAKARVAGRALRIRKDEGPGSDSFEGREGGRDGERGGERGGRKASREGRFEDRPRKQERFNPRWSERNNERSGRFDKRGHSDRFDHHSQSGRSFGEERSARHSRHFGTSGGERRGR